LPRVHDSLDHRQGEQGQQRGAGAEQGAPNPSR
jgi:hypothetical protein